MFGAKTKKIQELERELEASRQSYREMVAWHAQYGGEEAWSSGQAVAQARKEREEAEKKLQEIRAAVAREESRYKHLKQEEASLERFDQARSETLRLERRLADLNIEISLIESGVLDAGRHPAADSVSLQTDIKYTQDQIKTFIAEGKAVKSNLAVQGDLTLTQRRKLSSDLTKLALRAFNAETELAVQKATAANFEASSAKILRSASQIEKLAATAKINFYKTFVKARLKELQLAVDFEKAKKLERELEREHKAELREQARVERELQAERDRLEKEKQHYLNVLRTVEGIGDSTEAEKIMRQIAEIEKGIADVDYRQANVRAGYVYVISNLGSFGPDVVKIGMTRRLEPMDRVRELSDASVPFNFDVHALFFSEDAVGVETKLHQVFSSKRINKVNHRREFFEATPAQVKEALSQIAGNLLEFVEEPEAEQYRQSQLLGAERD